MLFGGMSLFIVRTMWNTQMHLVAGMQIFESRCYTWNVEQFTNIGKILPGTAVRRQTVSRCSVSALSEGTWTNEKSLSIPAVKVASTFTLQSFPQATKVEMTSSRCLFKAEAGSSGSH
jgi:hypothetical protein